VFPELLFRLARAPASSGPLIELFSVRASSAGAAASHSAPLTGVAKDKVIILQNLSVDMSPGATQAFVRVVFSGRTPAGAIFTIAQRGFTAVADLRSGFDWSGEVAIGGGGVTFASILIDVVFDAGVASNAITSNAFGYVIPRGNIAPF